MKLINHFLVLAVALVLFTACSDDPEIVVKKTDATISLLDPSSSVKVTEFTDVTISFTELNTQKKVEQKVTGSSFIVDLPQGSYEVSVNGTIKYGLDGNSQEGTVAGVLSELNLTKDKQSTEVQLSLKAFSKDFIIEEIFFTGNLTPEGGFYFGDTYIKLYNNTDEVLYADGLIIADSDFLTTLKETYVPDVMSEAFTSSAMVQIPGTGTQYPVEPGKSITIATDGINHKEYNTNSINLNDADFEIFRPTGDIDAPNVKNLINFADFFVFHNRGFHSYALVRLPEGTTGEKFLQDNAYTYTHDFVFNGVTYPYTDDSYKIPNNLIVDAVNLSVESEFQWIITDPSLDSGWTYCGKVDQDDRRFGKSVKRKVLQEVNGIRLLKDTNNSKVDFEPEATLSIQ